MITKHKIGDARPANPDVEHLFFRRSVVELTGWHSYAYRLLVLALVILASAYAGAMIVPPHL